MFRRAAFGAVAALTVGVLAVGCSEDGDTVVGGGASSARPSNFPGSQVDENNVAADARAFTPHGEEFEAGFWVFWNRANGHALVLFVTEATQATNSIRLMASHFDGNRLSAPVQIRGNGNGAVEDHSQPVNGVKVLWLNTSGTLNGRNGDAYILFTRTDVDLNNVPTNTSNEDANRRLWLSYFDVSAANAAPSGTMVNGFETSARVLDTDILSTGADTDIGTFGFVSDSLHNSHTFTAATDITDSGDPTTTVQVFYGKDTTTGANATPRFRFVSLDLSATANLPTAAGGTDLNIGAGAYDTGEGADITGNVVVHNNFMFWNSANVGTAAAGNDNVVTVTIFNKATPGGVGSTSTLNEALLNNAAVPDNAFMPTANNVYGDDHGLNKVVVFYEGSGYSDGATAGQRNQDRDVMIATFSLDNTTSPTVERAEIDNFTSVLGANVNGTRGAVGTSTIQTRISRSGNVILALWTGDNSDQSTGGPLSHQRLYARAYQTQLAAAAGATAPANRTLANSLTAVLTPPALAATTTQNQGNVTGVRFQEQLADGTDDRGCAFQGNSDRMNFLYQQAGDQTAGGLGVDQIRLLVNGVVVTRNAAVTTAPTGALVSTNEAEVDRIDTTYIANYNTARAYDAGDATTTGSNPPVPSTSAGRVIVFFISQDNNRADDEAPTTEFTERRLYAWENGTTVTVSSNPTDANLDFFQVTNLLDGGTVPVNLDTAQAPNHVGETLHVFWTEEESATAIGSGVGELDLGTRSYRLASTAATTAVALADRFTPPTSADASFIDGPGALLLRGQNTRTAPPTGQPLNGSNAYQGFEVLRQGTTVGVLFDQENRIYYQQTSSNASEYYKTGNVFTPQLVDNESDRSVVDFQVSSPNTCDNLRSTMIFFLKMTDNAIDVAPRGQVRIAR